MNLEDIELKLKKEYNKYSDKKQYLALLEGAETLIDSRIVSKGALFNLRDYETEISGFKIGKEKKSIPTKTFNVHVYYYDKQKRIVLIEHYGSSPNIIDREFCFYGNNELKTIYYVGDCSYIRNISLSFSEDNKTRCVYIYGRSGYSIRDYEYNNNILDKIIVKNKMHEKTDFKNYEYLFQFDNNGNVLKIIEAFPNGFQRIAYEV